MPSVYWESVGSGGVVEGGDAEMALRLSHPGSDSDPVSVTYRTGGGDAVAGDDYVAVPATAYTFAVGETVKVVSTATVDDGDVEDAEFFEWTITGVQNAQVAQSTGVSRILDNDGVSGVVVDDAVVAEGGVAQFTVRLTSPAAGPVDSGLPG